MPTSGHEWLTDDDDTIVRCNSEDRHTGVVLMHIKEKSVILWEIVN